MIVHLYKTEYKRNGSKVEIIDEQFYIPATIEKKLGEYTQLYRTSKGGLINMVLAYYFGDSENHLSCDHCALAEKMGCMMPEEGEQATIPLLDKGIVVVGLSTPDQGK